jgi:hypothetical protein
MKKFFSIFALISLAFSFGCGGDEAKKEDDGGTKDDAAEKPADSAEKPADAAH